VRGAVIQKDVAFVGRAQHAGHLRLRGAVGTLLALAGLGLLCQCSAEEQGLHHEVTSHGAFANVRVYRPPRPLRSVALVLSGDGGWDPAMDSLVEGLTREGALVAGINTRDWLAALERAPSSCVSPGASLADLGHYVAARYGLKDAAPVLVGHSAGATLAYVALAQAPRGAFAGAVTLSFCADLDLAKPLCPAPALRELPRREGVRLVPGGALTAPWVAMHGILDRVCPVAEARAFAQAIPGVRFIPIPDTGHTYGAPLDWRTQFLQSYGELARRAPPAARASP